LCHVAQQAKLSWKIIHEEGNRYPLGERSSNKGTQIVIEIELIREEKSAPRKM
jgi:hypothetical protein